MSPQIWNSVLTTDEIENYYDGSSILSGDESDLLGYWKMNEDIGSEIVYDFSGNQNHAINHSGFSSTTNQPNIGCMDLYGCNYDEEAYK